MRAVIVFGQFGAAADPNNLPHFEERLRAAKFQTILIQHTDSQKAHDFLHGYPGFKAIVGSSLGAGAAPIFAGYLRPENIDFVGGFQPSDWDPVMHAVNLRDFDGNPITRAVNVPANVKRALCFRNPVAAATGGLGHATYVLAPGNTTTQLHIVDRADVHPGDFGKSQDEMLNAILELSK